MNKSFRHLFLKLHDVASTSRNILLACHERADGDALGSLLGCRYLFSKEGRTVTALAPKSETQKFSYLSGVDRVLFDASTVRVDAYDAVILLDCGDVQRTHLAEKIFFLGSRRPMVAVIDHHPTTTSFRNRELVDLAIIDPRASSTCELVFYYVDGNRLPLAPELATALLTGIITDTGGFMNLATTSESLEVAGELLKRGANLRRIVNATVRSKSVGMLQLWGRALERLEHNPATGVISTALTAEDFEECGVDQESTEGIANFLNALGEGKLVLVLREGDRGIVKGSFRTKLRDVDVALLAQAFGGGGHKKAAGFTVQGKIVKKPNEWAVERQP